MCDCENAKKQNEYNIIEKTAKRLAVAEAKKTGKTVIYVLFQCKNGNTDFMDESDWTKAIEDGKSYTFIKYISSF